MTKADKIRSLDDDGLAEWLTELWFDAIVEGFRANGLPAAKPNKPESRDVKDRMLKLLREEDQKMDDYIRRSDAIKAMREWGNREENIRLVPAADVRENKRGKWICSNKGYLPMVFACSVCGGKHKDAADEFSFCPFCGAVMDDDWEYS